MFSKVVLGLGTLGLSEYFTQKRVSCCGIIGVLSKKHQNVPHMLSEGIQLLKNRGYDSAGIVTFGQDGNHVNVNLVKHADSELGSTVGCIDRVIQQVAKSQLTNVGVGIGHTRWATCGEKVTKNAHPHCDISGNIYAVHNGIISNHSKIKNEHLEQVEFSSETDSQVVVQLLGKYRKEGKSMMESIKKVEEILGQNSQWGLVIVDKEQPQKIYTSTNKSPILVGLGDQQIFIASQTIAFQKHALQFFQTQDGQRFQFSLEDLPQLRDKLKREHRLKKINQDIQVLKKPPSHYSTFYSYQIRTQGTIPFKPDFSRVQSLAFTTQHPFLTLIACGSSYYAGQASIYFFKLLKTFLKISIYDPAQLQAQDIADGETVVMISQSGETADLIKIVERCKKQKNQVKTIGIINVEGSTLARKVDFPIYIKVGREVSVAATKSMFHQVLNLVQFATEIAQKKFNGADQRIVNIRLQLRLMPQKTAETIALVEPQCRILAQRISQKSSLYLLAMRESLPIARQAALKIKELNYIHAQAIGACEMKHGPIALIQSNKKHETVIILWVIDNETYGASMNALDQMCSRGAWVVIITDCAERINGDLEKKSSEKQNKENKIKHGSYIYGMMIGVPKMDYMSFLLTLIPMQILVEEIAKLKGINPDMPRNLAKTVTV